MTTRRQLGPETRRALAMRVEGSKRRKILALVAAYIDAGRDPSISELAARARLPRSAVIALVDRLESDGYLAIERAPRRRNVYRLVRR